MTLVQYNNPDNASPFDSIRHYDQNGNEFWTARELMPLLGYKRWERVPDVISRAICACKNSGNAVEQNFFEETRKTSGRPQQDWMLTRYACYLVAMNGDSRKAEIAQAQTYFAIKTREAEVIIPQQNEKLLLAQIELEKLKLENENLKLKSNFMERRNAIQELHGVQMLALLDGNVEVVEVKETVTETVVCKDGRNVSFTGKSTAEIGRELGFNTGKALENWLIANKQEHLICQGMRAVQAPYIPEEHIPIIKSLFAKLRKSTNRQTVIGEF